jgi:hypothetical protein
MRLVCYLVPFSFIDSMLVNQKWWPVYYFIWILIEFISRQLLMWFPNQLTQSTILLSH